MKDALKKLQEFHEVYDCYRSFGDPHLPDQEVRVLRQSLLMEEFTEYIEAEAKSDLVDIADALADLIYVAVGTAVAYGIPIDEVFDEVHASNMSKLGEDGKPIYREDGKVLKGSNFFKPKIEEILRKRVVSKPKIEEILRKRAASNQ